MRTFLRIVLSRTVLLNLVFVFLMVAGAFSLLSMPVDRYPNVNMGKAIIETVYPGASPVEVETLVTDVIEESLDDLKNVEFIRSTSHRQRSSVVVKFIDDTDYDAAFDEMRFKVLGVLDELPEGVDPSRFTLIDVDLWLPVVSVNLVGDRSNQALTLMAKEMKIALRQIPGVKEVKLQGEYVREFHVFLNPQKLADSGVTFDQVAAALADANKTIPAGDFTSTGGDFVIKADERFRTRQQVMDVIIRTDKDGSFLRVSDVADDAQLTHRDPFVLSSVNGQDCVTLQIVKTPDGNALSILEGVKELVARFTPSLTAEGVSVVLDNDTTVHIKDAVNTLGWNLLLGVSLVCLVIWYFMGFRNAVITTVGIPFSFLFTMIFMHLTGNSLNEITLFSFVLVSGIVVDDAIVVVENIFRHVQEGEPVGEAVINGTAEVFLPVISATATTVCAFLPMLIMSGSTGEFFALIPKAISFALAASILECLFILPLHYRDYGPRKKVGRINVEEGDFSGEGPAMRFIRAASFFLLRRTLNHRWLTVGAVVLLLAFSLFIAAVSFTGQIPLIKVKFFPDDYTLYYVQVETPGGTPIEKVNRIIKDLQEMIMRDGLGYASSARGFAGFYINEDYQPVYGNNLGHLAVTLPAKDERAFDDPVALLDDIRERLRPHAVDGVELKVRPEKGGPPAGKDVNVRVVGSDPKAVLDLSRAVLDFLQHDEELAGQIIDLDDGGGQPSRVMHFRVNPEKAAVFGITPGQVVSLAAAVLDGRYLGKYRLMDEEVDFKLKLSPQSASSADKALSLPLLEHPSGPVRLGDLVDLGVYQDTGDLGRFQGERAITITGNLKAGSRISVPVVVDRVERFYQQNQTKFPGATVSFAGEFESTRKSYTSLGYAFLVALFLIYMILATQFSSYIQPLIIISAIAFALIGVILGKFVTQTMFTINSFVAVVGVAGVVVNDALVLIDFLNKRYAALGRRREALMQAVHIRLRPILLTTLTTTLGLLPMAVGVPSYSVVWGTMASTFVTGLCTSTFLTIIVVPVLWEWSIKLKERPGRKDKHA